VTHCPYDRGVVAALIVVVSYAIGTFPTAQLVGRRLGFDPTTSGSGNPGASNTTRVGGWKAGAAVLLGDGGKGILAAALGYAVDGRELAWLAGAAAVAGHVWPVTRKMRGGKGVATAAGVALVCAPFLMLGCAGAFGVLVKLTGFAAVGSIAVAVFLPAGVAVTGGTGFEVGVSAIIGMAIVVRHQSNIRRLFAGREPGVHAVD
jgi:glycerol-3-phosphate acyltransferase PlsY